MIEIRRKKKGRINGRQNGGQMNTNNKMINGLVMSLSLVILGLIALGLGVALFLATCGGYPPTDDYGNVQSDTTLITSGSTIEGKIETGSDIDYFSITTTGRGIINAYTTEMFDTIGDTGQLRSSGLLCKNGAALQAGVPTTKCSINFSICALDSLLFRSILT